MESHYMMKIWDVIGSKENQNLTVTEQQNKIVEILSQMKKDAEDFAKSKFKKECIKAVQNAVNSL